MNGLPVIRGNRFIGCNYGAARRGAMIDIFSELTGGTKGGLKIGDNCNPETINSHKNSGF